MDPDSAYGHFNVPMSQYDSDSEEDNSHNLMQLGQQHPLSTATNALSSLPSSVMNYNTPGAPAYHPPHHAVHPSSHPSIPSLPSAQQWLLEDIRALESHPSYAMDEYLLRRSQLPDLQIVSNNKRAVVDVAAQGYGHVLIMPLLARSGSCSLLAESHIYPVRCHQLRVLQEEFSQFDFASFLDTVPKTGQLSAQIWSRDVLEGLAGLLQMLVDIERKVVEEVRNGRRKD
ncbi:hypothetical protein EON64_20725, partial [archaeon]